MTKTVVSGKNSVFGGHLTAISVVLLAGLLSGCTVVNEPPIVPVNMPAAFSTMTGVAELQDR